MFVKFEFINTKKPKWHIYHTNNKNETLGSVITFKNNDTGTQFQTHMEKSYDYTSRNDYIDFFHVVMDFLQNNRELLPFDKDLFIPIMEKVVNKYNNVRSRLDENLFNNNAANGDNTIDKENINIPDLNNSETSSDVILSDSEESQIDTYKLEAEHQAATAIVEANMAEFYAEQQEIKEKQQEDREALIAEASRLTGRVEAFGFMSKVATVSHLMTLKKIKDSGIYKELPNIKTWEEYCKSIGYTRRHIDDQLESLNLLGSEFLETGFQFGLGYRDLKQLKKEIKAGNLEVKDAEVIIDGEVIPLDDKDELRDALDTLLKSKYKEIEELKDEIKTKESIIEDKEHDIKRLQASNNTFFKDKEQAERELKYLKAEGSINGISLDDNPDFQAIKQCENESSILIERLIRLAEKDLSKFNKSMLGGTVIKIMNDMHNLHQELCSKGISDYFGDAFVDDDVIDAEDAVTTPNMFLKQQGNEDE